MAAREKKKTQEKPAEGIGIRSVVAKNLRAILEHLGWGAGDFQKRTGFSSHFIAGVLRGDQNPSIDNLHVMARALGVHVYQVLNPRFERPERSLLLDMLELSNEAVERLRKNAGSGKTEPREALSKNLRRLLAVNGLTVQALAEDAGIAGSTIQKCLKGTQNVTIDNLDRIAKSLGVAAFLLVLPTDG